MFLQDFVDLIDFAGFVDFVDFLLKSSKCAKYLFFPLFDSEDLRVTPFFFFRSFRVLLISCNFVGNDFRFGDDIDNAGEILFDFNFDRE